MDAAEALDWRILEEYEPWGSRREDLRHAQLCAVIMNAAGWRKANHQMFSARDFLLPSAFEAPPPAPTPSPTPRQSAAQIERRLASFFGGHNARVREEQRRQAR